MTIISKFAAAFLVSLMFAGCSTGVRPSLLGTWTRTLAKSELYDRSINTVGLVFQSDGKLDMIEQPALYETDKIDKKEHLVKPTIDHLKYSDLGTAIRIISGNNSLDLNYELKDGKLFVAIPSNSTFGESGARQIFERK